MITFLFALVILGAVLYLVEHFIPMAGTDPHRDPHRRGADPDLVSAADGRHGPSRAAVTVRPWGMDDALECLTAAIEAGAIRLETEPICAPFWPPWW